MVPFGRGNILKFSALTSALQNPRRKIFHPTASKNGAMSPVKEHVTVFCIYVDMMNLYTCNI